MKILHIDYLNNGGPAWSRALAKMADLYCFITPSANSDELKAALGVKYDLIVCGGGFYGGLSYDDLIRYRKQNPTTRAFSYYGDARLDEQSIGHYCRLGQMGIVDIVFCANDQAVEVFNHKNAYAEWAPHPVDDNIFFPNDSITERYDWCFTGNHQPSRRPTLANAKLASHNYIIRGFGHEPEVPFVSYEESAIIYRQSKIVLTITAPEFHHLKRYFSDRLPMGLLCGRFNLTNYQPDLETVFKQGVHLDWYQSDDEMIEKIRYYLEHDDLRNEIARNGYALARQIFPAKTLLTNMIERTKCRNI